VSTLAWAGWPLAVAALACAALLRVRLARHHWLVAEAGHELRGPLCAARLGLHALGASDATASRRVEAVDLELRRASLALEDLASAPRGVRASERVEVLDVGDLVVTASDTWRALAQAHGADVIVEPGRSPALVHGDRVRLAQACGNLVANAVEHGAAPVHVRVRTDAERVRVEVSDGGPGLPDPVADLVAASRRHGHGSRGHGLAVAAAIAQRHGGRLAAAPSAAGARLVVELPVAGAIAESPHRRLPFRS
jgi:signal transduction histidine kinase